MASAAMRSSSPTTSFSSALCGSAGSQARDRRRAWLDTSSAVCGGGPVIGVGGDGLFMSSPLIVYPTSPELLGAALAVYPRTLIQCAHPYTIAIGEIL